MRPLKVFLSTPSAGHRLCHAHADRDPVRALYARLTKDFRKRTPTRTRGQKQTPSVQIRESVIESVENLCHAHADRDAVRGLYIRLTKDGVDAWLDKAKPIYN